MSSSLSLGEGYASVLPGALVFGPTFTGLNRAARHEARRPGNDYALLELAQVTERKLIEQPPEFSPLCCLDFWREIRSSHVQPDRHGQDEAWLVQIYKENPNLLPRPKPPE
jgi:hypothetical protein